LIKVRVNKHNDFWEKENIALNILCQSIKKIHSAEREVRQRSLHCDRNVVRKRGHFPRCSFLRLTFGVAEKTKSLNFFSQNRVFWYQVMPVCAARRKGRQVEVLEIVEYPPEEMILYI